MQDWDGFVEPANVLGPMTELTVWEQKLEFALSTGTTSVIEAMQATSPPSAGPARAGVVTGDSSLDLGAATAGRNTFYFDLRQRGPIVSVQGRQDRYNIFYFSVANALGLTFANGTTTWIGSRGTDVGTFSYPGYVVATARALGRYDIGGGHTADAVIFGFRRPDSFLPSAAAISLASGTCLDLVGGVLVTGPCHAGLSQIWGYYAGTKALVAGDGTCLALGSDQHSLVTGTCTEVPAQQWELVPSAEGGHGQIRSVPTGLVLEATSAGPVVAATPDGGLDQAWAPPSPDEGQVHGIGQGRCMTIPASGSTVVTWACDQPGSTSTWQLWTYDSTARSLSLFDGTKCAQAMGTVAGSGVMVADCTGAPEQQWLLGGYNIITSVPSGLILEVQGGSTANGTPVTLQPNANSWSQRWSRPSDQGAALYALGAGKCLDVASPIDGTQPTIQPCAGTSGQRWVYHSLTQHLTAFNGQTGSGSALCLAVDPTGTKVVVTPCSIAPSQQWTLTRGSDSVTSLVQHTASGQCLTLPGAGTVTAAGTTVEVQPCRSDASQVNQQWQWGGVS